MVKQRLFLAFLVLLTAGSIASWWSRQSRAVFLTSTVADLSVVHAGVKVGHAEVRGVRRLSVGDRVVSDADGRARLRLDNGSSCVIDRGVELELTEQGFELLRGRVFVVGEAEARVEVGLAGTRVLVQGARAGIERQGANAKVYAAHGGLSILSKGKEHKLALGDEAKLEGAKVSVAPARAFDDWTGGLAAPWGVEGAPRRAVGELWGRPLGATGAVGSPLTLRAHEVDAKITGEVAETRVKTTFFNGGSTAVDGDFRMAVPADAIVARFAWGVGDQVKRGGLVVADPKQSVTRPTGAVLEWAGEGWLRGSFPAIPSGSTATVVVEYVQWMVPRPTSGRRVAVQYRYPMVSTGEPPLIGELVARIDASASKPHAIAPAFGAVSKGDIVEVRRSDYRPNADLVVDLEIDGWSAPARLYAASAAADSRDGSRAFLVRTELPPAKPDAGATLVLVVDVSGSSEAQLDAARAVVEAVVNALGTRDRVLVLAADQSVRPVGPEKLGPASPAHKKAILAALVKLSPGGASDLGRAFEAGADALPPEAVSGLVVYVGDGWQTVGDPTAPHIMARLGRRAAGVPRLGAVAVGPVANRALLGALVGSTGPLLEVADSSDAAEAAIRLVGEALKPTIADVSVDLGPEVEHVYPRRPQAILAGSTVTVVAAMIRSKARKSSVVTCRARSALRS